VNLKTLVAPSLFFILVLSSLTASAENMAENKGVSVVVTTEYYDGEHTLNQTPLKHVSVEKVDILMNKLLTIEHQTYGLNRIMEQVSVLDQDLGTNLSVWETGFESSLNNTGFRVRWGFPKTSRFLGGLMLVSHFTPHGFVTGSCFPFKPLFYNTFISYSHGNINATGVTGILPWYVGFSFSEVHITAVGLTSKGLVVSKIFFPFFEVLIPCAGTSVRVYEKKEDGSLNILFEYNLDLCLVGLLTGLDVNDFSS